MNGGAINFNMIRLFMKHMIRCNMKSNFIINHKFIGIEILRPTFIQKMTYPHYLIHTFCHRPIFGLSTKS